MARPVAGSDLEEQKTKFVRHVSHELKTPLTALREGAELLADEVVGDLQGEQKEVVHILRQNSIRLQKLIEDLLHFNVAASSQSYAALETQRLDDIITRVVHDHKLTLVSKGIRVVMDLAPLHIEGEAEKLRVIIDYLLSNTKKYSPQGGTVRQALKDAGNDGGRGGGGGGPGGGGGGAGGGGGGGGRGSGGGGERKRGRARRGGGPRGGRGGGG